MENKKILRMRYTKKEIALLMDSSIPTLTKEIENNTNLYDRLKAMGYSKYRRFNKTMVLEIFKYLGYPSGYEHYALPL